MSYAYVYFTRMSSHKTNWILFESPLLALACLLFCSLIRRISLRNLYKCKQAACCCYLFMCLSGFLYCTLLLLVYFFSPFFYTVVVLACILLYCRFIFYTDVVAIVICLFVNHINKSIIFVFGAFVYHLKSFISNFVKIF